MAADPKKPLLNCNITVDYASKEDSIKHRVSALFQRNPRVTAKKTCSILHLSYPERGQLIRNYLSEFRRNLHFGNIPSVPISLPHRRIWVWNRVVWSVGAQERALSCGWKLSRNRNGMLVFRSGLGSVEWFQSGTVLVLLRVASHLGYAKSLVSQAFSWLDDAELLRLCEGSFREIRRHWVFEQGKPMIRFEVRQFQKSHGLRIFSDGSHPSAVEVEELPPIYLQMMIDQQDKLAENLKSHRELIEAYKIEAEKRAAACPECVRSLSPGLAEDFWRKFWRVLTTSL